MHFSPPHQLCHTATIVLTAGLCYHLPAVAVLSIIKAATSLCTCSHCTAHLSFHLLATIVWSVFVMSLSSPCELRCLVFQQNIGSFNFFEHQTRLHMRMQLIQILDFNLPSELWCLDFCNRTQCSFIEEVISVWYMHKIEEVFLPSLVYVIIHPFGLAYSYMQKESKFYFPRIGICNVLICLLLNRWSFWVQHN